MDFRFSSNRYDTSVNEPPADILTVLRCVEISNVNVFNAIVDQTQAESVMLIDNDDCARELMCNAVNI